MLSRKFGGDEGQSLIQFALIFIALLAFVALAVDTGNAFATRRKLQNAADAAALAAARELCLDNTATQATNAASTYLVNNGARPIGAISSNYSTIKISGDNTRVDINARGSAESIFGDLITDQSIEVTAFANSACGRAASACGLWPVIFKATLWDGIECGKTIAVWDAANDNKQVECFIGGKYEPNLCKCYDCDSQNVGIDDFMVVSDVSRGWLDFPATSDPLYRDVCKESGAGAAELKCTVANDYQGRMVLPTWVKALNGVKASALKEVENRVGDQVRIPLYGSIDTNMNTSCYDVNVDKFYVTKFGCATVDGVEKNKWLYPLPGMPKSYTKVKITAVMVTKSCDACTTECGTTDGTVGEPWELRASSLVK
jgi:hypothetical protein